MQCIFYFAGVVFSGAARGDGFITVSAPIEYSRLKFCLGPIDQEQTIDVPKVESIELPGRRGYKNAESYR